jgi:hypothetical protein
VAPWEAWLSLAGSCLDQARSKAPAVFLHLVPDEAMALAAAFEVGQNDENISDADYAAFRNAISEFCDL